jgi:nitrate reductase alpha subunit
MPKDVCGPRRSKTAHCEMSLRGPGRTRQNWPRNMFVWRSNLLGSSGKGHEYFMQVTLLGTRKRCTGQGTRGNGRHAKPAEVNWHEDAPQGKLDLLVTLDFRMSTTCLYSDIVLPTASLVREKRPQHVSDMHPFIHPLLQRSGGSGVAKSR